MGAHARPEAGGWRVRRCAGARALSGCHIKSRPGVRQQILYPPRPPDPSRSAVPVGSRAAGRSPRVTRICRKKYQREPQRASRDATLHAMRRCTHTYMLHLTISLIQLDTCHVRKSTNTPAHRTAWAMGQRRAAPYRPSGEGCWHQTPRVQRQGGAFRGAARDPRSGGARRARVSQPKLLSQRYRR
jgi:hypothetical protein